jgi:predicted dehydrogenase
MGELAIEGIYPLAIIQMLTGASVRRVFARATAHFHQLYADNNVEDLASLTLEMEDGLVATVALGRIGAGNHASGGESKIRVLGETGALVVNEARPDVAIYYRDQPVKEARERRVANEYDFLLADNFANAIDHDGPTILDVRSSLAIFATVEAALESCRLGQPVAVR